MIDLIIRFDGTNKVKYYKTLTLKEIGEILVKLGARYHLVFETVRDVESGIGCTLIIGAIEKG